MLRWTIALTVAAALLTGANLPSHAADPTVARGEYLVRIGGCTDCHTPGHFMGKPDMKRFLGGSDVGFGIPGVGTFVGPNLTPDKETGLGKWTNAEIVTAITTGVRPDGRLLAPVMPWRGLSVLTKSDALAIATYLRTLPPISNKVPGPFGPSDTPSVMVMSLQPGDVYAAHLPPK